MANYEKFIINDLIRNELIITFPDNDAEPITEENIAFESMSLKRSICDSEALTFGGCIASEFSIDLINTDSRSFSEGLLIGKWISVKIIQHYNSAENILPSRNKYPSDSFYPGVTEESEPFNFFSGFIDSAKQDKSDSNIYHVIAYDAFAKLYNEDATEDLYKKWKNGNGCTLESIVRMCLPSYISFSVGDNYWFFSNTYTNTTTTTTKQLNEYVVYNGDWLSSQPSISKGALLKNACELVAAFGRIVPNESKGDFRISRIASAVTETYEFNESLFIEEYVSTGYTDYKFPISGGGSSSKAEKGKHQTGGLNWGNNNVDKTYDFTKNILAWQNYSSSAAEGRTSTEFDFFINTSDIGKNLALELSNRTPNSYQPLEATLDTRLWFFLGKKIKIQTSRKNPDGSYAVDESGNVIKDSFITFVLSKTTTGIQALTDKIITKGVR